MTESGREPEDQLPGEGTDEGPGEGPGDEQLPENQTVPYGFQGTTPARGWAVYLAIVLVTAVLILMVVLAVEAPTCEHPSNSWAPCIGP